LVANTIPNCISYDPTYSYELAVIVHSGLVRMYEKKENVFYYITTMNELYTHPEMPKNAEEGIIRGMYALKENVKAQVQLMGCGTILREVERAHKLLLEDWSIESNIWSVTSFNELTREAQAIDRINNLSLEAKNTPYITKCLQVLDMPVVAATDYMRNFAEQVRKYVPNRYEVLGTDGFGRSDSRKALREFFEVNAEYITLSALKILVESGDFPKEKFTQALEKYHINLDKPNPMSV
jgi:pyruvate dehydrogenase E1 component